MAQPKALFKSSNIQEAKVPDDGNFVTHNIKNVFREATGLINNFNHVSTLIPPTAATATIGIRASVEDSEPTKSKTLTS